MKHSIMSWAVLLLLLTGACGEGEKLPSRETLIRQATERRVQKYQREHRERCQRRVLESAKRLVDSIMLANARRVIVVDSTIRPPKPTKPEQPIPKSLEDTLEIGPLLPIDSSEQR